MDIADDAERTEALQLQAALHQALKAPRSQPLACGLCHFCDATLAKVGQRFCDGDCSRGWEREQSGRRRNGYGADD